MITLLCKATTTAYGKNCITKYRIKNKQQTSNECCLNKNVLRKYTFGFICNFGIVINAARSSTGPYKYISREDILYFNTYRLYEKQELCIKFTIVDFNKRV